MQNILTFAVQKETIFRVYGLVFPPDSLDIKNRRIMDLLDILKRETESTTIVYLYEENGRWYAYENSALLISQLLKDVVSIERIIYDTFLILSRVEVEPEPEILVRCHIISCSDTELMISFPDSLNQAA